MDCICVKETLRAQIETMIRIFDVSHFLSGMDLGAQQWGAELVLALKAKYPGITLEVVLPYEEQAADWTEEQRDRYFTIIAHCDKETLLQRKMTPDCLRRRDTYMLDQSSYVIAISSTRQEEMSNPITYARKHGKTIIAI